LNDKRNNGKGRDVIAMWIIIGCAIATWFRLSNEYVDGMQQNISINRQSNAVIIAENKHRDSIIAELVSMQKENQKTLDQHKGHMLLYHDFKLSLVQDNQQAP
jgi:uncharacterized protein HemX